MSGAKGEGRRANQSRARQQAAGGAQGEGSDQPAQPPQDALTPTLSPAGERERGASGSAANNDSAVAALPLPTPSRSGDRSYGEDQPAHTNPFNPLTKSVDGSSPGDQPVAPTQPSTFNLQPSTALPPARGGPLAALRYPNYRLVWLGQLGGSSTNWMEQVAYGWLILDLTGSALLLGTVGFFRAVPQVFFALVGGLLADRMDRKRLLQVCQTVVCLAITTLAVLTTLKIVQVWHVFVIAFVTGTAQAIYLPSRQSIVNESVPKSVLGNALALNSLAFNISRVMGPTVAGIVLAAVGTSGVFWIEAVIMLGVIGTTLGLRVAPREAAARARSARRDLAEGFRYVAGDPFVRSLLLVLLFPVLFAWPYQWILPVFARDALGVGPEGLGLLLSGAGAGAIVALISLVTAGDFRRKTLIQLGCCLGFGIGLMAFSRTTSLLPSLALIAITGGSSVAYNVLNQTLLQTYTPDHIRGRVIGIQQLVMGLTPVGSLLAGAITDHWGAPTALFAMGAVTTTIIVILFSTQPVLRNRLRNEHAH